MPLPFHGNAHAFTALRHMIRQDRIPHTLLLSGPEGIGKATLARRFAAELLGDQSKVEHDDLSLPGNTALIGDREKWTAEKRNEDPLLFATHPDFVTFPPDGPLRQITIQQMRALKERAQYKPLHGAYRVFLIDQIDRANEQAANSLLKTLEEPPDHLILIMTAANAYDLLPTIRSRAVPFHLGPLDEGQMREFLADKQDAGRRIALAGGSPGAALSLDLESYDQRRAAMLKLLEAAAGAAPFAEWAKFSESIGARKDKFELYLKVLYVLLEDVLLLFHGHSAIRNIDIRKELEKLAAKADFRWMRVAVAKVDEMVMLVRRNIQKSIALDAFVVDLRESCLAVGRGM